MIKCLEENRNKWNVLQNNKGFTYDKSTDILQTREN